MLEKDEWMSEDKEVYKYKAQRILEAISELENKIYGLDKKIS